jgi:histidine ammonia-lyase
VPDLMMALKALSLARGASGVRWQVIALLEDMRRLGVVTPVVPAQGSVGASGDLAPLAHMTAVMIGEGEAFQAGPPIPAPKPWPAPGCTPSRLARKRAWR